MRRIFNVGGCKRHERFDYVIKKRRDVFRRARARARARARDGIVYC